MSDLLTWTPGETSQALQSEIEEVNLICHLFIIDIHMVMVSRNSKHDKFDGVHRWVDKMGDCLFKSVEVIVGDIIIDKLVACNKCRRLTPVFPYSKKETICWNCLLSDKQILQKHIQS